ncbi:AtpZ/AtpI family protein [Tissierella pigra]|uniref:AtpZ/AtpI family protein n=1 Tax=Tissierella pigra TaxID=2607614 RepID=A0A6N7XQZ1_9FIRM|nr:AtpZ/AtpI family protein [Tissierella pigra]MBU5427841.1 AtpZ/AtpI family protein [Tissierella pigra]MSU00167.1 AtpZ/AtpI family protein [Tissierella pigra]
MKNKNYKDILQNVALVSQMGISIITPILLGVLLGQFIDKKLGTNYAFSIIFIILGSGAGFLNIFKLGIKPENKEKKDE